MVRMMEAVEKPHAVCLPAPAQGHITPMLKLAKILHTRGFYVTFVNTEFNHRRLLRSRGPAALNGLPDFRFASMPDGLPPSDADATQEVGGLCYSIMTAFLPHFMALLGRLGDPSSGVPPVTCLVVDGVMSFGYDAAKEIGVPCAALWTSSACGFMGYRHYRQLIEQGFVPFKDESQVTDKGHLDTVVHGVAGMCDGMRLRDFPNFIRTTDRDDVLLNFIMYMSERLSLPDAVLLNTFDELEGPVLDAMRAILPPMYTVGPLHRYASLVVPAGTSLDDLGSNLWTEQHGLLEWLDGQSTRSVVYVNYGSITVMTNAELLEFAWGLASCGYPFIWNIRPDLVKGDTAVLPPEFLSAIDDGRSMLTTWCSQEKVIAHDAVGVFVTHSGWNSTLESICAGVPMLSWPFFAEQQTNCRYKCTEWGNGMEIGGEVKRAELAAMIREVMEGAKGQQMRKRAAEWKEKAVRVTMPGGPVEVGLDTVIRDVLLATLSKLPE
ncbi:Cytokinin-O-glucosyltransferase 2 [Hordeum vulgare]|uniref:Glycosyltransferase n=2 Tax=Hordeum vulgare subsp. vulgare TaxID=112509 RepID=A0A8I6XLR6_HORVV|nr:Cytokinin-O-glucosyltransferase 2 [Hordeum vulgare]